MRQAFLVWEPIPGQRPSVSVEAVVDDWEGFRILVRNKQTGGILRLAFDGRVAYQCRDESDLDLEASRSDGLRQGCFYTVMNSEFAQRVQADSARKLDNLRHYAIITDFDCIDVLTLEDPEVDELF